MRGIGRLGSALRGSNSICPVELGVVALLNWSPPSSPSLWLPFKIFHIPCKDMMCRELRESSMTRLPVLTDLQHAMTAGYEERTGALCDETKFLTDTETETFYPRQIFPIPIPRLFFRDQIFRDRYRDFFSETKFSDTNTETFFSRPNFSIPIPRLSKNCHGSRDWDRDRDFCIWLTNFRDV